MAEVPEYPSNNVPAKQKQREKKVEKVISGNVRRVDKSKTKRFSDIFLAEDANSVKDYIIYDRLIPGIKEMILSGLEMMFLGNDRGSRRGRSNVQYVSYNKMYGASPDRERRLQRRERDQRSRDVSDFAFDTKGEALEVLDTLTELIDVYGQAQVSDFYDAIDVTSDFTDCNYGWVELGDARIRRIRGGGYCIDLPRPIVLR